MRTEICITPWQKRQAALLYYFSSVNYLKGLKVRVDAIRALAEGTIDQSGIEGRGSVLRSSRWGDRNTSENWANNAWPFLADFQVSVTQDLAIRAQEKYKTTGANQCGRGMAEFSMQWTTPAEQHRFDEMFAELSQYALNLDETMDKTGEASKWHDYGLTIAWQEHKDQFQSLPKFRVLESITAESGSPVSRTGVYVSSEDPDAALQFAWSGTASGRLLNCTTLNSLGKDALMAVGRSQLWVNGKAMLDFVNSHLSRPELSSDPFFEESRTVDLAPTLVARNAFASHPTRWCYVELISDEFEATDTESGTKSVENVRFRSGMACPDAGTYFSPAGPDSRRHFEKGEIFPDFGSQYGTTFWQLDANDN